MRRWAPLLFVLVACTFVAGAPAASAAQAKGCSGEATSLTKGGSRIDSMTAPGAGGTKSDPFVIYTDSRVKWSGQSDRVIQNGSWRVEVAGLLPIPLTGDIKNEDGETAKSGNVNVSKYLKFDVFGIEINVASGLYKVDFVAKGKGGATCSGTVWVKIDKNPITPALALAIVLVVFALFLFFIGMPEMGVGAILAAENLAPGVTGAVVGSDDATPSPRLDPPSNPRGDSP